MNPESFKHQSVVWHTCSTHWMWEHSTCPQCKQHCWCPCVWKQRSHLPCHLVCGHDLCALGGSTTAKTPSSLLHKQDSTLTRAVRNEAYNEYILGYFLLQKDQVRFNILQFHYFPTYSPPWTMQLLAIMSQLLLTHLYICGHHDCFSKGNRR